MCGSSNDPPGAADHVPAIVRGLTVGSHRCDRVRNPSAERQAGGRSMPAYTSVIGTVDAERPEREGRAPSPLYARGRCAQTSVVGPAAERLGPHGRSLGDDRVLLDARQCIEVVVRNLSPRSASAWSTADRTSITTWGLTSVCRRSGRHEHRRGTDGCRSGPGRRSTPSAAMRTRTSLLGLLFTPARACRLSRDLQPVPLRFTATMSECSAVPPAMPTIRP